MDRPDSDLKVIHSREEIRQAVQRMAAAISRDYQGKTPLVVGVLKGSFIFMADLVRALTIHIEIEFVWLSSYGKGTESSGKIRVGRDLLCPVEGRDVLVVEDIVDTGLTLNYLLEYLRERKPASLRLCALVDKPSRRQAPVSIDYLGFTAPDRFIVGYGLDWDEKWRCLPDLCVVEGM
ncbi:MAG: hypoxanthine phosphoribosyltransferase [Chloroflexi bacterium]|nr:hypoxanthine phosphoribosyltransferase [Chloroflexota bacterium]